MRRRALIVAVLLSVILSLATCGSEAAEQAQVPNVTATSVPTTAPLSVPTSTAVPAPPASAAVDEVAATPLPTSTVAAVVPTATLNPAPSPTATPAAAALSKDAPLPTVEAEVSETPTPVPTPTVEEPEAAEDTVDADPESGPGVESTPVAETPTAAAAAPSEPPLECFDADVQIYRAFVDGVDELSFEGGRVYCSGAGTNAVSAANSYRHSSGLVVVRNADYIFNDAGTAYIPYSGSMHFCINGLPASAPFRAETVPALLIVIDNEAQRQLSQGASGPVAFTAGGAQC